MVLPVLVGLTDEPVVGKFIDQVLLHPDVGGWLVVGLCLHHVPCHFLQFAQVSSPLGVQGSRRMPRNMLDLFCLGSKLALCHFKGWGERRSGKL